MDTALGGFEEYQLWLDAKPKKAKKKEKLPIVDREYRRLKKAGYLSLIGLENKPILAKEVIDTVYRYAIKQGFTSRDAFLKAITMCKTTLSSTLLHEGKKYPEFHPKAGSLIGCSDNTSSVYIKDIASVIDFDMNVIKPIPIEKLFEADYKTIEEVKNNFDPNFDMKGYKINLSILQDKIKAEKAVITELVAAKKTTMIETGLFTEEEVNLFDKKDILYHGLAETSDELTKLNKELKELREGYTAFDRGLKTDGYTRGFVPQSLIDNMFAELKASKK